MYSLEDDASKNQSGGNYGTGVFRPGVNVKFMNISQNSGPIMFKILPAYDPAHLTKATDREAWVPNDKKSMTTFRDTDGRLTVWARIIKVAGFIGHGSSRDGRRDFVGAETFPAPGGGQVLCPLKQLYNEAERDPEFKYLTQDKKEGDRLIERTPLSLPRTQMLANVVVLDSTNQNVQVELGVFSTSAYKALLGTGDVTGLAHTINASISDPEYLQSHPMARWACGDLTDLNTGPTLVLSKGQGNGKFSSYTVNMATDQTGQILRTPIHESFLEHRYNLLDVYSLIDPPNEEKLITEELPKVLNGFSPNGVHEWEFLRKVFGHMYKIPDPPARGSYSAGFSSAPAQAPAANPVNTQMPTQPTMPTQPAAGTTGAPAPMPQSPSTGDPMPQQPVTTSQAPVAPATAPAVAPTQQGNMAPAMPAQPEQKQAEQPAAQAPVAPGTQAPPMDQAAFLSELESDFPG